MQWRLPLLAPLHGVPKSTLKDRPSGHVVHRTKSGPKPYLCPDKEKELIDHLIKLSIIGLPRVLETAENIATVQGKLRKAHISGRDGGVSFWSITQECHCKFVTLQQVSG